MIYYTTITNLNRLASIGPLLTNWVKPKSGVILHKISVPRT